MAIEIFTSTSTVDSGYEAALNEVLGQAGFTARAASSSSTTIISTGAIFDHTFSDEHAIKLNNIASAGGTSVARDYHLAAVVDKDRKILYIGGQNIMGTVALNYHMNGCLYLMAIDGDNLMYTALTTSGTICYYFNLPNGRINQVQENALSPLCINDTSDDFCGSWNGLNTSFYTSLTLKNEALGTIVTDGTNTFTSCGNLIYIKNA